jgi:tetratricopeptide (TPR) repeat protein
MQYLVNPYVKKAIFVNFICFVYSLLRRYNFTLVTVLLAVFFVGCTQYKDKPINRGYHNLTSRFNVYFYANESLNEGISKLEENHKDDYTQLLPLYIYGNKETCKEIFPEMDRTIKKASLCITRHAIKDKKTKEEVYGAVKWIDNAWIALGKAHFYKREFFDAIETFEFVANSYKSKEKYEAWLWLVKTYNEMGLLSKSDSYINLIKNESKFPKQFKSDFGILYAEFYIKQGLNEEAIAKLNDAIKLSKNKKQKARFYFVLGQLYETRENDTKKAVSNYRKTLSLKPAYELEFNTRIKLSLLADYNEQSAKKIKLQLTKMLKDVKNSDYLDVIYYTLGQLEEREKNYDLAFEYYKKSASNSKNNSIQKSKSYLRIAEMSFDKEDYPQSKLYYDSTLTLMKEEMKGYKDVLNKKNSLDVLVFHINTIKSQDSLLKIARMDSSARIAFIQKIIIQLKENEQKQIELLNKQQAIQNNQTQSNTPFQPTAGNTGSWYFYNQQTKTFGINDFTKKWGNQRKNEDNWRRLNKASVVDNWSGGSDSLQTESDSSEVAKDSTYNPLYDVVTYLKDLPLNNSLQDSAVKKIINSYYSLGTIYREQLNNTKRSISTFMEMNQRYPKNSYEVSSYYQMYRIYLQQKNDAKAEECKNYILTHYPNSDYALLIKDPNFANAVNAKKSEVESFYTQTYLLYESKDYSSSLQKCNEALKKYSKNDFSAKFAYLRALCIGKTQTVDSLENAIKKVIANYPSTEVELPSKALLAAIQNQKPKTSADSIKIKPIIDPNAYLINDSISHYWVISIPQNRGNANAFKTKLSDFNNQYYSVKKYEIQTIMLETTTVILLKSFTNKSDADSYQDFISKKPELFSELQKEVIRTFTVSESNLILLIKKKNIEEYFTFYQNMSLKK